MRSGATQSSPVSHPDMRVTVDGDTYASVDIGATEAQLVRAYEDERIWGGVYHFYIDNSDGALDAKDYKGKAAVVNHSFVGTGGSDIGDLWVDDQEFISREGKLLLHLTCIDAWGLLSRVKGTVGGAYWNHPWQNPDKLAELALPDSGEPLPATLVAAISAHWDRTVNEIVTTTISDALGMTVDVDDTDAFFNIQKPQVSSKDARSMVAQAMGVTESYLLWKADGKFHVIEPGAHGVVYSYNTGNLFFNNTKQESLVIPNRVIYWFINKVDPDDSDTWLWASGEAVDATSYARLGIYIDEHHNLEQEGWEGVSNQADADARAAARLAHLQLGESVGTLVAPMHCAQELFDKISITDSNYSPAKTITGYVFRIIREYDRGVYKITLQLGGVEGGYTPPTGDSLRVTPISIAQPILPPGTWQIPKAIQGFQHDLHFTATDQDTVAWDAGTIKFYDGVTQNISSGSYDIPDAPVRYIYFDLDDASPNVLKVTDNYISVMSEKTGVVCLIQKGSTTNIYATVIPSYGKEPLITPDVIQMNGLLEYDYGAGKKLQTLLETQVSAGLLKLTAVTIKDDEWYNESGVEIDARHGINIYGEDSAFTTRATKYGTIQCKVDSSGRIVAGSGNVTIDASGIKVYGETLRFYQGANYVGWLTPWATIPRLRLMSSAGDGLLVRATEADLRLETANWGHVVLSAPDVYGVKVYGAYLYSYCGISLQGAYTSYFHDIIPKFPSSYLGSYSNKWGYVYRVNESGCDLPTTNSALDIIKRIPKPKHRIGDYGERHYFDKETFPDEMRFAAPKRDKDGKPTGEFEEPDIEFTRVTGVLVEAVRELTEKVESLERRS